MMRIRSDAIHKSATGEEDGLGTGVAAGQDRLVFQELVPVRGMRSRYASGAWDLTNGGGSVSAASMMAAVGGIAVTTAVAWWVIRWMRRWRTTVRLRWIQAYHASLQAELQMSYERVYTRCADQPAWGEQKLADMEWAFAEIDSVLERRRLDDLTDLGRTVPSVAPPVTPVVLGGLGAAALMAAALMGP